MFPHSTISEVEALSAMAAAGPAAVSAALGRERLGFGDFLALLGETASAPAWRERIRARAATERRKHFGHTVRLYTPLYVSNACINSCAYCGFRAGMPGRRRRLSLPEIRAEGAVIRGYGIGSLLLVSGEDPAGAPVSLLAAAARMLQPDFPYLSVEIYPLDVAGYRELVSAGVHGVTLYQETYDRDVYSRLHPSGPKRDFAARIEAPARAAQAGMYVLGIGALLGLRDWRGEAVALALHGLWLRKHFWRCRLQFSFPRITPVPGFTPACPVGEDELERLMLAFRCFFPEADITVSTRETPAFRDRSAQTVASHLSAASCVVPGGYADGGDGAPDTLGQFTLHDTRTAGALCRDLIALGLQPVWKDWDATLGERPIPASSPDAPETFKAQR